ncbi:MAG TPA: VanZ family protein [Methylobacter sp.]|jgi:VanZ family protein
MSRILDFTSLFLYCLLIYWLSNQPTLPVPRLFAFQDKILHAGAYFIMGVLAWRSFKHLLNRPMALAVLSTTFCSLYGISDEWHQSFVDGRSSDIFDWVADTSGAGLAVFFLHKLRW